MAYNILDDEDNWKRVYAKHLSELSIDDLLKEMRFVGNHFTDDDDSFLEKKIRLSIISDIIKNKLDLADNKLKGVHILSEQEYKDLLTAADLYDKDYNIAG